MIYNKRALSEGVHDKGIFKAVFLTGGPNSGKDYVLKNALSDHGLTEINSDKLHDHLTNKEHNFNNSDPILPNKKIKNVSDLRQLLALYGRNGLIVNGNGDDPKKTKEIKKRLEKLGYDSHMIHVHTDDEVSKKRNIERSQKGGRSIPEKVRKEKWDNVQNARQHHAKMFGSNYHEFDNSHDLRDADPETMKNKREELSELHDHIADFINTPSESPYSNNWIEHELENSNMPVPRKGSEKMPNPASNASKQASEAGLQYFGSGRYGKDGKVTHHSISDNLRPIVGKSEKGKDEKDKDKPIKKNKNIKEAFDNFLNESVSDIPEEDINFIKIQSEQNSFMGFRKKIIKVLESIDQGIEPGISMASSGENLARPSGEKNKKDGKANTPGGDITTSITELTGDESTATIGDQKEDELKKVGINLSTFRSKKVI